MIINQYEHCILWTLSLRIPLYKAARFAGIPGISFLQILSTVFVNFLFIKFLYSFPFPAVSFTFSAKCTLFFCFFLCLFFSSTHIPRVKKRTKLRKWNEKDEIFPENIEESKFQLPEYKQERRVFSWGTRESWFWGEESVFGLEKARKRKVLETTIAVAKTTAWELIIEDILNIFAEKKKLWTKARFLFVWEDHSFLIYV